MNAMAALNPLNANSLRIAPPESSQPGRPSASAARISSSGRGVMAELYSGPAPGAIPAKLRIKHRRDPRTHDASEPARYDRDRGREHLRHHASLEVAQPRTPGHDEDEDPGDPAAQSIWRCQLKARGTEDRRDHVGPTSEGPEAER